MYFLKIKKINDLKVFRLQSEKGSFVDIIPQMGAMVHQMALDDQTDHVHEVLESDSKKEIFDNPWFRGRILFPFNDRIPKGKYSFGGKDYQLPINSSEDNSALHGFVYDKAFKLESINLEKEKASILLKYSIKKDDFHYYPFSVDISVQYIISDEYFSASFKVHNRDDRTIPFALGWHPYFKLGSDLNLIKLKVSALEYIAVDRDLNPTGEILPVENTDYDFRKFSTIGKRELDIAIIKNGKDCAFLENDKLQLKLDYNQSLFPYTQLFIPPSRKSIAIEPISGASNSFNLKGPGRIDLKPGEAREGMIKIALKANK